MAITRRAVGSWVAANATTQTVTLPTHVADDMLIVRVGAKHPNFAPTITCDTADWNKLGQSDNAGGASSNGGGGVAVAVFWKIATSGTETNPVIRFHASVAATPSCAVASSYQKGASDAWVTPEGAGGSIAAALNFDATMDSHIAAKSGDVLDAFAVTNDNTTLTVPTVTQAGLTLDTVTESPATALSSGTSNDISADGSYRTATAGTSSAAAHVTGTNSIADPGEAWVTRLRVASLVTGSFTADAVIKRNQVASVTADAVLFRTQLGSLTADAVLFRTQLGFLAADAVIKRTQTGSFAADAIIRRLDQPGSFTVDAVVRREMAGAFSVDAVIAAAASTVEGSLTADAVLFRTQLGSFAIDAVIKRLDQPGSFAVDAVVQREITGSFAADAVVKRTMVGSLSADAIIKRTQVAGIALDATLAFTVGGSFLADAILLRTQAAALVVDAIIKATQAASITADAIVRATRPASLTADTVVRRERTSSFAADAIRRRTYAYGLPYRDAVLALDPLAYWRLGDQFVHVCGAECGITTQSAHWAGSQVGTVALDTSVKRSGTQSYRFDGSSGNVYMGAVWTGEPYQVGHASFRVSAASGSTTTILALAGASTELVLWVDSSLQLRALTTGFDQVLRTISVDTWYDISWRWFVGATTYQFDIRIDSVPYGPFTDPGQTAGVTNYAYFGNWNNSLAGNVWWDDIAITTEPAVYPMVFAATQGPGYSQDVVVDAPLHYWRLGESSGTVAVDDMGTADGAYVNTPTLGVTGLLTDDPDTAVQFVAASGNEYVDVTGYTTVPATLSIEAWLRGSSFFDNGLAGWRDGGATDAHFYLTPGQVRVYLGTTQAAQAFVTYEDDAPHHLVFTYDGTNGRLYFDGSLVSGPTSVTFSGGTNSNTFKIAQYGSPSGTNFDGIVDEVAVYDYAMSALRVAAHYNSGVAPAGIEQFPNAKLIAEVGPDGAYGGTPTLGAAGLLTGDPNTAVVFDRASQEYAGHAGVGLPAGSTDGATMAALVSFDSIGPDGVDTIQTLLRWAPQSDTTGFHWLYFRRGTGGGGDQRYLGWQWSTGTNAVQTTSGTWIEDDTWTPVLGQTYRIAVSHDYAAKRVDFYVDGQLLISVDESARPVGIPPLDNQAWFLGAYASNGHWLDGTLDEPSVFAYALSAAQVADLHRVGLTADAILRKTIAASLTADAVLRKTQSGSFTADAVVIAPVTQSGSFTADAILLRSISGSFTADAVLLRTQPGSFTADAVLRSSRAESLTADAIVSRPTTSTFSVDAIVRATRPASLTVDAVISRTQSNTYSTDAVLRAERSATFTCDAIIRATATASLTADAVILKTQTAGFAADAVLLAPRTVGVTADAVILSPRTSGFSVDAFIVAPGAGAGAFTADAVIRSTQTTSFIADAVLRRERSASVSVDAFLRASIVAALSADAVIFRTQVEFVSADAILSRSETASFGVDAFITASQLASFGVDAVIRVERTSLLTAAAILLRTSGVTFDARAIVRATASANFSADAWLLGLTQFTIDAVIRSQTEFSFTVGAVITKLRAKRVRSTLIVREIASTLTAQTIAATVSSSQAAATLGIEIQSFTVDAVIVS